MRREYRLQPLTIMDPIEFAWDPDTGLLEGRDAVVVRRYVEVAERRGTVMGDPYPTVYDVGDVLRSERDMALVLGQSWVLPEDLRGAYPAAAAGSISAAELN